MACVSLAKKYADETKHPIPQIDETVEVRSDWLVHQNWCCQDPKTLTLHCDDDDGKSVGGKQKTNKFCNTSIIAVPDPLPHTTFTNVEGIPMTHLQETGFLAWVNESGMQCINKLTGIINGYTVDHGVEYKEAGQDVPYIKSYCHAACYNVTAGQESCFECIAQVLEDESLPALERTFLDQACPTLYNKSDKKTVDTQLMQDSLSCHTCIGENSKNLTVVNDKGDTVYNEQSFENIWGCVTGKFP
jgi:hypothetical protein